MGTWTMWSTGILCSYGLSFLELPIKRIITTLIQRVAISRQNSKKLDREDQQELDDKTRFANTEHYHQLGCGHTNMLLK